ncbi:MAG: hypothetical protein L0Y70_26435 [Gemmataceae bacterium]|nr:hypothetical protein [Gemmataceae bacterium]
MQATSTASTRMSSPAESSPRVADWIVRLFGNRKPLGFSAGDSNLYRYVANSPVIHTDPSGLDFPAGVTDAIARDWLRNRLREINGQPNGRWSAPEIYALLGLDEDAFREGRRGCVGLANVRLGTRYMSFPIFNNQSTVFRTFAEADLYRKLLLVQPQPGAAQPRIFAVQFSLLNGVTKEDFARPDRPPQWSDINLSGGYDFWTLHEPQGSAAFWEHVNHSFTTPNPQVIHSPFEDGVNNRSAYPFILYGVVLTRSRWMPPGPNVRIPEAQ